MKHVVEISWAVWDVFCIFTWGGYTLVCPFWNKKIVDVFNFIQHMLYLLIDYIVQVVDVVTIIIIFFGFCYALYLLVAHHTHIRFWRPIRWISLHRIRVTLGEYLLLALEFFICADVILSVKDPSYEHLAQLGIVVIIRIMIAYFLQRELQHLKDSEAD